MGFPGQEGSFNADKVEEQSYDVVDAGRYTAIISQSMTKQTKAGTGSYLSLMFIIQGGAFANRTVWVNLNLDNPNKVAVGIAERELASICKAVNVLNPEEPEELHGLPMAIKVSIRPETPSYPAGNDIKAFYTCTDEELSAYESGSSGSSIDDDDIPF